MGARPIPQGGSEADTSGWLIPQSESKAHTSGRERGPYLRVRVRPIPQGGPYLRVRVRPIPRGGPYLRVAHTSGWPIPRGGPYLGVEATPTHPFLSNGYGMVHALTLQCNGCKKMLVAVKSHLWLAHCYQLWKLCGTYQSLSPWRYIPRSSSAQCNDIRWLCCNKPLCTIIHTTASLFQHQVMELKELRILPQAVVHQPPHSYQLVPS